MTPVTIVSIGEKNMTFEDFINTHPAATPKEIWDAAQANFIPSFDGAPEWANYLIYNSEKREWEYHESRPYFEEFTIVENGRIVAVGRQHG